MQIVCWGSLQNSFQTKAQLLVIRQVMTSFQMKLVAAMMLAKLVAKMVASLVRKVVARMASHCRNVWGRLPKMVKLVRAIKSEDWWQVQQLAEEYSYN